MSFYHGDDLEKKKQDAKLIGKYEDWEKLPLRFRCTVDQAKKAVDMYGPSRAKVESYLERTYGKR